MIRREKKESAKRGRRHKNYVYAGFDKPEEFLRLETKCKFAEGVGITATLLAEIVSQGVAGLSERQKEAVKKATLKTVMDELAKV